MNQYDKPEFSKIAAYVIFGIMAAYASYYVNNAFPRLEVFAVGVLGGLGAFCAFAAGYLFLLHLAGTWLEYAERRREIETTSARLREMDAARGLTPEQLAVIPKMDYGASIGMHADPKNRAERRFFLITADGNVPYEFCQSFLMDSGVTFVKPVSSYAEGTTGYDYARWFTNWLRLNGYAIGGEGSTAGKAAQWMGATSKAEACEFFGVTTNLSDREHRQHFTPGGNDDE